MVKQFSVTNVDKKTLEKFRVTLRNNFYTYDHFLQFDINPFKWNKYDLPIFAYRFPATSPFGILFNLFFLGRRIKIGIIKKIFHDNAIRELLKIKFFEKVSRNTLQSNVFLVPYKAYHFAGDFILQLDDRPNNSKHDLIEYVYHVRLDSITLCEASIKRSINSALDLGCGSGILSIVASRYSKRVVGIDINPRAVNFSRFNALLNNVKNCQFICGDLYNPINNDKYDLILSNPPYEINPKRSYLFQNGGEYGYSVLQKIIRGASKHLNKGGFCQIITKIAEFSDKTLSQLIYHWIANNNLHIFFIRLYKMNIYQSAYAICTDAFFYENKTLKYQEYARNIGKILDLFNKHNITGASFGIITLTQNTHFSFSEQSFDSHDIQTEELPKKLQDKIYMHFQYLPWYGNSSVVKKFMIFLVYLYKRIKRFFYNS